jgi:hypothetical protein
MTIWEHGLHVSGKDETGSCNEFGPAEALMKTGVPNMTDGTIKRHQKNRGEKIFMEN